MTQAVPMIERDPTPRPSERAERVGRGLAAFENIVVPTAAQKMAVQQMDTLRIMGLAQPEGEQRRGSRYLHPSGAGKSTCAKMLRAHVEGRPGRDPATRPVLHVTLTTTGTPKSLASSILDALGDNYSTHHLKGLSSAVLPTTVRNALKEVLATISSSPGSVPPDQIGMREAALLTGQEERKLAAARRAGQLGTRICLRANRLLPTLDRREVETLNAFLHSRVGPEAASHRLGLPQYALHLIAREGLIRFADHPYVVAHYGRGQMDGAELVRFQDRLRDCATGIDLEDPVPLRKAARAIGGGAKPWGTIVRGLMTGGIPFGMGGDGIDGIVISGLDAARIRTFPTCGEGVMPLRCISQRDAVEILNLPLRHANLLGRSLKTGGSLRLPVADVLELARVRVTLAELCALTGIHGTRLEAMLEKDGCSRRDAMGWSRDVAIESVARL